MTEGMRNTMAGVISTAVLAGLGVLLSQNNDNGKHFTKIDTVLEQQTALLKKVDERSNTVPAIVALELNQIQSRLDATDQRLNDAYKEKIDEGHRK
ncbi:MAG: hypothetical protein WBD81_18040 [Collimonas pratensis]|uniref:hypothetical protein n=1 Tax=Collimonas pratensis TaxID=279113 RepID=UPI003C726C84